MAILAGCNFTFSCETRRLLSKGPLSKNAGANKKTGWRASTAASPGGPSSASGRLPAQSMTAGMGRRRRKLIVTSHRGLCGFLWRGAMGPSIGTGMRTSRSGRTSAPRTSSGSIGRTCRSRSPPRAQAGGAASLELIAEIAEMTAQDGAMH